ncbi:helix-turn-helix domain-containing protein [Jannaschia sp. W003]|uniref:helix-turn-helix domain-containing protein n=1 Tax=Jannaschia sp. W003 TaxID=2867012 RepID=UPI0021A763FC|nr:helix-turn-helix domain-containing protein [Jannaschia sp. W003]UWQ20804.1 helix-turn-helix domain-containing protein [Jannaschia sp. W003]
MDGGEDDGTATDAGWYDPEATTFGDRLSGAREAAGMGQAALARRLGVKATTLRAWEEDRAEPRANRVQMLAGLLNVSLIWLMTGQGAGVTPAQPGDGELLAELDGARREALKLAERIRKLEIRVRARMDRT